MKKILFITTFLISGFGFSQSINDYKYVVVPKKFEWLKEENRYNLNSLTKMLFEKYGWEVYQPLDKMPDELALDRCKALYAEVVNESGFLNTKLAIELKDCNGKLLFKSVEGSSKEKNYQKAYYEALREASQSVAQLNYKYSGKDIAVQSSGVKPQASEINQPKRLEPASSSVNAMQLFAQPITNGYQLVDSTPKVIMKLYKTSQKDSYTAVSDTKNGVVFKKDNDWVFEYYQNDILVSEKLNIKF